MNILGIGPTELILIILLALVLVGPRDLAKFGRDAGRFLNKLYHSPTWRTMNQASREIRNLPTRLAREAEIDTVKQDLDRARKGLEDSVAAASQALEKEAKGAGEGMQAWTPPTPPGRPVVPPSLRPPSPTSPAPATGAPVDTPAPPETDSPYAEG